MVTLVSVYLYVCERETWTERAYGSHYLKSTREDQVFEYDALVLDNASMLINNYFLNR